MADWTNSNELFASASRLQVVRYVNVATIMVFIFDYVITLNREIKYIWRSKWGVGKFLYLATRYPTFAEIPRVILYFLVPYDKIHKHCAFLGTSSSWLTLVTMLTAEGILILRTYAVWDCERIYSALLMALFLSVSAGCTAILVYYLPSVKYAPPPLDVITGCYKTESSPIILVDYCIIIFLESVIIFLTLRQGVKRYLNSNSQLVTILYRDCIFYFIFILITSVSNIVVLSAFSVDYADLLITFQLINHSVLTTRVLLHIREACYLPDIMGSHKISKLFFGLEDLSAGSHDHDLDGLSEGEGYAMVDMG